MRYANANVNLMVENGILIKSWININVDASAKIRENIICVEKIIFGIPVHVFVKMANNQKVLLMIQ